MMGALTTSLMAFPRRLSLLAVVALTSLLGSSLPSLAQPNLRSTFPGRRVGGATRGECSSRLIAHLVPSDSVFAAGDSRLIGILQGPTANPRPVQVNFRPAGSDEATASVGSVNLPAGPAGLVLLRQPAVSQALRWESTYQCDGDQAQPSDDPLSFISAASPPAISLLLAEGSGEFTSLQKTLQQLSKSCGGTVSSQLVASSFGMDDLIKSDWPAQLPVRCVN